MPKANAKGSFEDIPALANPTTPALKRLRARLEGREEPRPPRRKLEVRQPTPRKEATPEDPGEAADAGTVLEPKPFKPSLTKPHPLIAQARQPAPKPDKWGYIGRDPRPRLDMSVSKEQERNAFVVLDRLFKALEEEGIEPEVRSDNYASGTFAVQGSDKARIRIEETYRQIQHTPTKQELADKEKYGRRIPKTERAPTGRLTLIPGGVVDLSSEEALSTLVRKAVDDLKAQLSHVREQRQSEEARRREEARREQEKRDEKERVTHLHQSAEALDQYRKLIAYIEEVRRAGRPPSNQRREGQTLEQWLQWAEEQARRIHPLG